MNDATNTPTETLYDINTTDYVSAEDLGVTDAEYAAAVAESLSSDDPTGAVEVNGRTVYAQ